MAQDGAGEAGPESVAELGHYQAAVALAIERFEARSFPEAREAFEQAHRLQPSARTWRGLGFAAFYENDYAFAANAFERALVDDRNALTQDQRQECETFLARAGAHAGRLRVSVEPEDAHVAVDDEGIPPGPRYLEAGEHHVRIELDGYETVVRDVRLEEGEELELHIVLSLERVAPEAAVEGDAERKPPAVVATTPAVDGLGPAQPRRFPWAWVVSGTTLALGVTAAAFGVAAKSGFDSVRSECERTGCDEARRSRLWDDENVNTYETLTTVTLIGAGLGLATTITLFAVQASEADVSARVAVTPGRLQVAGSF